MSNLLEGRTQVSLIAAQMLDDMQNGRSVRFGNEIEKEILVPVVEENKTKFKTWLLLIAFCVVGIYYAAEFSKNKVTGVALDAKNGKMLGDSKVVFYCLENKKQYTCNSDEKGSFCIRLPSGKYKFWVKDHGSLETSKATVDVAGECNYRVASFKK
jgi:hypothetical protein